MQKDVIIVGQGIAGSVLADHLTKKGLNIVVFDDASLSNSSKVAGGLYNPITGRKMVKTWNADALFGYLEPYYLELEESLETNFLKQTPIYRPFLSIEELNEWMGKSAEPTYAPFVLNVFDKSEYGEHLNDQYGGLLLNQAGYLDTQTFLSAFRKHLEVSHSLVKERFDFEALVLNDQGIEYKGLRSDKIIFTDGQLLTENPFFKWLPMRPVKGELLFIKSQVQPQVIYNRGVFVVPLKNGLCKVGSTYDHNQLDDVATEAGRNELTNRLRDLITFDFEVVDQKAGVRPATKDRKPFIGWHPEHKGIGVFNGLGTKGVSLAPYYANQFADTLCRETELDTEVNISRFFSLY